MYRSKEPYTVVHVQAAAPPAPAPSPTVVATSARAPTPEARQRANSRARETRNINQINAQKVARYEEFFAQLLRFPPATPLTTILPLVPRMITDNPAFRQITAPSQCPLPPHPQPSRVGTALSAMLMLGAPVASVGAGAAPEEKLD